MKLDELEKMAQQTAAFGVHPSGEFIYSFYTEQLQAFAKLIAEHERTACANLCEQHGYEHYCGNVTDKLAETIRARGKP